MIQSSSYYFPEQHRDHTFTAGHFEMFGIGPCTIQVFPYQDDTNPPTVYIMGEHGMICGLRIDKPLFWGRSYDFTQQQKQEIYNAINKIYPADKYFTERKVWTDIRIFWPGYNDRLEKITIPQDSPDYTKLPDSSNNGEELGLIQCSNEQDHICHVDNFKLPYFGNCDISVFPYQNIINPPTVFIVGAHGIVCGIRLDKPLFWGRACNFSKHQKKMIDSKFHDNWDIISKNWSLMNDQLGMVKLPNVSPNYRLLPDPPEDLINRPE